MILDVSAISIIDTHAIADVRLTLTRSSDVIALAIVAVHHKGNYTVVVVRRETDPAFASSTDMLPVFA